MSNNGNGAIVPVDGVAPPWVTKMREAAAGVLTVDDVKEIVANQVALAKKGDRHAITFVFQQLLGGNQLKPQTLIQNNNYGPDDRPAQRTIAKPGTEKKLDVMRKRAAAGLPLGNGKDAPHGDLD
jgi:hypothetical protein